MNGTVAVLTVVGSLSVGVGGAVVAFITGRATARKTDVETRGLDAKLPAEVDSVVVAGAEQAVITMAKALDSANLRIDELQKAREADARDREADRKKMTQLQARVDELEQKVDAAEVQLREARDVGRHLSEELRQYTSAQDRRKSK